MTVTTDTASITHSTDGSTVEFPVSFYFLNENDLLVDLISAAGVLTRLILGSNYTVDGAGNQDGGSVTTVATYAAGSTLRIYRNVAATQLTEYQQNDAFPAKTTEKALDKLTMLIQQEIAATLNSLRFPIAEYGTDGTLPAKGQRIGQILGFDEYGRPSMIPIPASVGAGDLADQILVAGVDFQPGVTTQITLNRDPGKDANMFVWFSGAPQFDFVRINTLVTFNEPIPAYVKQVRIRTGTTISFNLDSPLPSETTVYGGIFHPVSGVWNNAHFVGETCRLGPLAWVRAQLNIVDPGTGVGAIFQLPFKPFGPNEVVLVGAEVQSTGRMITARGGGDSDLVQVFYSDNSQPGTTDANHIYNIEGWFPIA